MLRRTAAKAFGSVDAGRATVPPAPHETRRAEALERLFRDLHKALEAGTVPGRKEESSDALRDARGEWKAAAVSLRVTRPRSLAGGMELTLEGPAASFAFLNTLAGFIRIGRRVSGTMEPLEIVSVARQGGSFRPIRKDVRAGEANRASRGERRSPFAFTSATELACGYLEAAKNIQKIDSPPLVS